MLDTLVHIFLNLNTLSAIVPFLYAVIPIREIIDWVMDNLEKSIKKMLINQDVWSSKYIVFLHTMCTVVVKPGSYFLRMRMRSEFDVNLTSQPSFRSDICKWVEQSWTAAKNSLRICAVNIRIAFAFAGSMNRALVRKLSEASPLSNLSGCKGAQYMSIMYLSLHWKGNIKHENESCYPNRNVYWTVTAIIIVYIHFTRALAVKRQFNTPDIHKWSDLEIAVMPGAFAVEPFVKFQYKFTFSTLM